MARSPVSRNSFAISATRSGSWLNLCNRLAALTIATAKLLKSWARFGSGLGRGEGAVSPGLRRLDFRGRGAVQEVMTLVILHTSIMLAARRGVKPRRAALDAYFSPMPRRKIGK